MSLSDKAIIYNKGCEDESLEYPEEAVKEFIEKLKDIDIEYKDLDVSFIDMKVIWERYNKAIDKEAGGKLA